MKKIIAILLSALLMVSVITSCTDGTVVDGDDGDNVNVVENDGSEVEEDVNNSEDVSKDSDEETEEPEDVVSEPEYDYPEDVVPEKVLKFTISNSGVLKSKSLAFNVDVFNIPAGSTLEYDVYLENDVVGMGNFEIKYSSGTYISWDNDGTVTDNANIATSATDGDITDYAYGKWYHRVIQLYDGGVDSREIDGIRFGANDLTQGCTYVVYYDNICIKDSEGNVVKEYTEEEILSKEFSNSGGIECSFEVVDDPQPRFRRKSAEDFHVSKKEALGTLSEGSYVDVTVDMDDSLAFNGIYFGAEDPSYIEDVNCYVVYKTFNVLSLYHVTDSIALASSVRVVNMVDDLIVRFSVEGSDLKVSAYDEVSKETKLLWSVPVNVQAGVEYGKIDGDGLGFAIATELAEAEDKAAVDAITPYDPSIMKLTAPDNPYVPLTYLNCSTDKNPLEYAVGESMVFEISSYYKGEQISCPMIKLMIEGDDGDKYNEYSDFYAGSVKVITNSSVPGFEYIEADAATIKKAEMKECLTLTAGAGAGIHDMTVTKEKPADFESFWQGKIDELETVEPVLLEAVPIENADYDIYCVKVEAGKYGPVTGKVSIPKNAEPGTLKAKVVYMGYGVGDVGISASKEYITFSVSAHSIDMGQPQSYYSALNSNELKNYGFNNEENSDRETVYFLGMLIRDVQAVRYLMASEYWNGVDVEIEGGSQGGFQSIAVGALVNEYATKITAWAPAFCDWAGMTAGRLASVFPFPDYQDPLAYFDSVNFATMIKAPVTILSGLGDTVCRPSGISLLYDTIKTPKDITWVQNMTHGLQYEYSLTYTYSAE